MDGIQASSQTKKGGTVVPPSDFQSDTTKCTDNKAFQESSSRPRGRCACVRTHVPVKRIYVLIACELSWMIIRKKFDNTSITFGSCHQATGACRHYGGTSQHAIYPHCIIHTQSHVVKPHQAACRPPSPCQQPSYLWKLPSSSGRLQALWWGFTTSDFSTLHYPPTIAYCKAPPSCLQTALALPTT